MDKVRIYVVAGPNQGKTTVAHILRDALKDHGFKRVELADTKPSTESKQPIEQRVAATKERPVFIEVVSVQQQLAANAVPSIIVRAWLATMKNARNQLATLGSSSADAIHQAHLKDLDDCIEELLLLTR